MASPLDELNKLRPDPFTYKPRMANPSFGDDEVSMDMRPNENLGVGQSPRQLTPGNPSLDSYISELMKRSK